MSQWMKEWTTTDTPQTSSSQQTHWWWWHTEWFDLHQGGRRQKKQELLLISTIDLKKKSGLIHHNQQDGPHIIRILIFFSCLKQLRSTRRPAFSIQQDDFISLNFKCVVVWLGRFCWLMWPLHVIESQSCCLFAVLLDDCSFIFPSMTFCNSQQAGGFRSIIKAVSTSVIY